jgi:hypothetical protein
MKSTVFFGLLSVAALNLLFPCPMAHAGSLDPAQDTRGDSEPGKRDIEHAATRATPSTNSTDTKVIPLPIYATLPSEGSTFGFMPVFLVVRPDTETTQSIYAPSYSWNRVIGSTGTFRWFHYPNDHQSLTITGGASTKVNYGGLLVWNSQPKGPGQTTDDVFFRWGRSIFYQFFGIGPNTTAGDLSSNTRIKFDTWYRKGWNIGPHFNLGARLEFSREIVESIAQPGDVSSTVAYPNTPGMGGSTVVSEAFDVRYDSRPNGDYSNEGSYVDLSVGPAQGVAKSPDYWVASAEGKVLIQENDWLQGGARLFSSYVTSPQVPFYHQSSLGGSFLMRGFTEDRFFDQGAWTFELEQRFRVLQTHIYGVTADWRVDPFVAMGQVWDGASGPFSHLRYATGLGFRAWVRPNVVGRVDVAVAGEGLLTYVELGYPF